MSNLPDNITKRQSIFVPFIVSLLIPLTYILQTLSKMSPTSLKLTLEQLRRGRELDLKGCLRMVRFSLFVLF